MHSVLKALVVLLITQFGGTIPALAGPTCGFAGTCEDGEKCCRVASQTYCARVCTFSDNTMSTLGVEGTEQGFNLFSALQTLGLSLDAISEIEGELEPIQELNEVTGEFEPLGGKLCFKCSEFLWHCKWVPC